MTLARVPILNTSAIAAPMIALDTPSVTPLTTVVLILTLSATLPQNESRDGVGFVTIRERETGIKTSLDKAWPRHDNSGS
jgi:hypothetical protein